MSQRPIRKAMRLSNGDTLTFDVGFGGRTIKCGSKSIDLYKLKKVWLDGSHDRLLRPGKSGNDMRYANSRGDILLPYLEQVYAAGDHALAILEWRWEKPNWYVHLARIDTRPTLKLTLLRRLAMHSYEQYPPIVDTIFKVGSKTILLNGLQLEVISKSGRRLANYGGPLPFGHPMGLVENRWLLWIGERDQPSAYDLRRHVMKPLKRLD